MLKSGKPVGGGRGQCPFKIFNPVSLERNLTAIWKHIINILSSKIGITVCQYNVHLLCFLTIMYFIVYSVFFLALCIVPISTLDLLVHDDS